MKTKVLRTHKSMGRPVALLLVYLLMAGILLYAMDYIPKDQIENGLIRTMPWTLWTNLLLIVIGLVFCRHDIAGFFTNLFGTSLKKIKYQGVLILLIVIAAFVTTSFVAPRTHRIYFDEDIYANVGQNIAISGQAAMCNYGEFIHGEYKPNWTSFNKEPNGWPFLISLAFQIFGTNELYAFILNNLMLAAGIGLIFIFVMQLTNAFFPSIMAALTLALIPHHLIWSNTAAAEPSAAFFTLAAMLCLIVYLKSHEGRHLYLLAVMLPFASQMRPESILILPLSLVAIALVQPRYFLQIRFWGAGILAFLLLAPQLLHFYAVSGQSWGADGAKFSLSFFCNNIMVNGMYYMNNHAFPVWITVLSVLGLLFSRYSGKWKLIVLAWFVFFWGIFLFFYAGSYRYGADVRFAVLTFAPLSILSALGMEWLKNKLQTLCTPSTAVIILVVILFGFWIKFLPMIRLVGQEAWAARADHNLTREFVHKIPERSIIVTHIPTMLLLWGQNAVSVYGSVNDDGFMRQLMTRYEGNVYFHYNYWCNTSSDVNARVCRDVKKNYNLEKIVTDESTGRLFGLYRIRMKEAGKK